MAKRKREQQVTSDNNVSGTNKRSSISVGGETDYFDLIPVDLFNDILSRLPVRCKLRLRCVSKNWYSSIILDSPRLLLAFNVESKLFVYSSTKPQDLDVDSSVVATPHHTSLGTSFYKLCRPLGGLVCSLHTENKDSWAVISNPITGDYVTTPKVSVRGASTRIEGTKEYSFGYDPINKQFKVLRITWLSCKKVKWGAKYHVLTLETGNSNLSWRNIQSCTLHYPLNDDDNGICINGVLYYTALSHKKELMMVCFDVRFEKFSFTNIDQDMVNFIDRPFFLINYKGKLGVTGGNAIYRPYFQLWVLEDAEKHKWSKQGFKLQWPHRLLDEESRVAVAGMIGSEDIVLSPTHTRDPFFIYYYNLERKNFTRVRVEVPVVDESKSCRVYTFPNFVEEEELKLM